MLQLRRRAADFLGPAARRRRQKFTGPRPPTQQIRRTARPRTKPPGQKRFATAAALPPPRPRRRAPIFWDLQLAAADTMTSAHGSTPDKTPRSKASANQQQTL